MTGAELGAGFRIAPNFVLGEFRGWEHATAAQVERLVALVTGVLQPIRDAFGRPLRPTSWVRWSSGQPRTGAHADGGAVDFVVDGIPTPVVHAWAAANLAGRFGELIDERDHIHVTRPGLGGNGEVLVEPTEGVYVPVGTPTGVPWRPSTPWYELPGIVASVPGPRTWLVVGGLVAALLLLVDPPRRRAR